MSKYKNRMTQTADGIVHDSVKEARRWDELKMLERAGVIKDLERQVRFELIPSQREADTIGKRGGIIKGKVIERPCYYIADFVYKQDGQTIVEDTKGVRTEAFRIKKKLMLQKGYRILET